MPITNVMIKLDLPLINFRLPSKLSCIASKSSELDEKFSKAWFEIHPQPIDLQLIFAGNLALFNPRFGKSSYLSINRPTDRSGLRCENERHGCSECALKRYQIYTGRWYRLNFQSLRSKTESEIVVADTGISIPPKACDPVSAGQSTGNPERLAKKEQDSACFSVKNLYKNAATNIWIESEVGKGTTCRFCFVRHHSFRIFSLPK